MSFQRIITTAIRDAGIAEAYFDSAIKAEGFKSHFDWFLRGSPPSLQEAYNARVAAEKISFLRVEQPGQLAWLITTRSSVRIRHPLPVPRAKT